MIKISETDYLNMSKDDLYKEYCKIYNEYENLVRHEIERLKMEINKAKIDLQLSCIPKPIPYLMHKEMDIPLLECQKAYDIAIEHLRSQGKVRG